VDPLTQGLTSTQRQAVLCDDARILSVAVAGSGKTRVLTHRIVRLLRDGVPPDRILAVTFTNDAAEVMRERVRSLLATHGMENMDPPEIRTFHAWGLKLVQAFSRQLGMWSEVTVYDSVDLQAVADSQIGRRVRQLERRMAENPDLRRAIEDRVAASGAVTFNMIERFALDILAGKFDLDIRDSPWGRFDHVLVDEYQDVNLAQALVVERLAPANLFVTGDAEQAIYGFRGAQPQRLRDLLVDAGWTIFELDLTFRHGGAIVDIANMVRPDDLVTRSAKAGSIAKIERG
jgi:superfamily I DNA/RNA helicase